MRLACKRRLRLLLLLLSLQRKSLPLSLLLNCMIYAIARMPCLLPQLYTGASPGSQAQGQSGAAQAHTHSNATAALQVANC